MNPEEKELLRQTVLEILAARHPAALPLKGIARRLATELGADPDPADVESALAYLQDLGLVAHTVDDLGSTRWYRATTAGIQQVERSA